MSSVFTGQKNYLTFNKAYPYLSLFPGPTSITSTVFCTSAIDEPSPDYSNDDLFKVGEVCPETGPAIRSWGSEHASNGYLLFVALNHASRPGASARPVGRGFVLAKHKSSSGSHARAELSGTGEAKGEPNDDG